MSHGIEFSVVFTVCVVLVAGAATRHVARRINFPYTVAMMLLGVGIGLLLAALDTGASHNRFVDTLAVLAHGAHVSPHVILFVFLPALVFESAYAVDQHALWKERGAVGILAGPALLLSTAMIGAGMVVLTWGVWEWGMTEALVFGALISATDPVAVVAILREVNAPKRLGVLIEGESLLNDGTAIVVFTVLLGLLVQGDGAALDVGGAAVDFVKVVAGGVAVGLVLGVGFSWWLARTFNDPLVEISHTLAAAYLAMIIAEGILHVSGVIAIVVAALWLGGRGRTSTSPEVEHFLHQFWQMLAYIANTVIFFLVGLVVSEQLGMAELTDLLMVLGTYVIVMAVRGLLTYSARPVLASAGSPLTPEEAAIISWGGLRGAVSLALALIIVQTPAVDPELGRQILLTTAGVVLLTVFVNGATTGWMMRRLGLTRRPPSVELAQLAARASALDHVHEHLADIAAGLPAIDWAGRFADVRERRAQLDREIEAGEAALTSCAPAERAIGYWLQALAIERRAYWSKFGRGTLSASALRAVIEELDRHQDCLARGEVIPPAPRSEVDAQRRDSMWSRLFARSIRAQVNRLSLLYDIARAESVAAAAVLRGIDRLADAEPDVVSEIRTTYERYLRVSKQRIEEMRIHVPELVRAIELRLATRIQLNIEREEYEKLMHRGLLGQHDGEEAVASVEQRMKQLAFAPVRVELPPAVELCRSTALFAGLDDAAFADLTRLAQEHVFAPGEVVFASGDRGASAFVIARGAAEVVIAGGGDGDEQGDEQVIDVLGSGDVFGEMALLTGESRSATVRAATTLTLIEIEREPLEELIARHPGLGDELWRAHGRRLFDNTVADLARFGHLDRAGRLAWIGEREHARLDAGHAVEPAPGVAFAFVIAGVVTSGDAVLSGPVLVDLARHEPLTARDGARIVMLPHPGE